MCCFLLFTFGFVHSLIKVRFFFFSGGLGHSVCCHVHGFEPYFYISCPPGMGPDDISRFHQTLEVNFIIFFVGCFDICVICFVMIRLWLCIGENEGSE